MYKLWVVDVQGNKKPYIVEKVRLLAELDQKTANNVYERSMKHPHISENILWMSIPLENKYGVVAKTFCLLEDYTYEQAN